MQLESPSFTSFRSSRLVLRNSKTSILSCPSHCPKSRMRRAEAVGNDRAVEQCQISTRKAEVPQIPTHYPLPSPPHCLPCQPSDSTTCTSQAVLPARATPLIPRPSRPRHPLSNPSLPLPASLIPPSYPVGSVEDPHGSMHATTNISSVSLPCLGKMHFVPTTAPFPPLL